MLLNSRDLETNAQETSSFSRSSRESKARVRIAKNGKKDKAGMTDELRLALLTPARLASASKFRLAPAKLLHPLTQAGLRSPSRALIFPAHASQADRPIPDSSRKPKPRRTRAPLGILRAAHAPSCRSRSSAPSIQWPPVLPPAGSPAARSCRPKPTLLPRLPRSRRPARRRRRRHRRSAAPSASGTTAPTPPCPPAASST